MDKKSDLPSVQTPTIQGVYEVGIGVTDLPTQIAYWQQFGYQVSQTGDLDRDKAQQLYGVYSPLRSVRLGHQLADHGLIRLMAWQTPTGEGLGLQTMKLIGNRWATTLTADLLNLFNHIEVAAHQGLPLRYTAPEWSIIYQSTPAPQPFVQTLVGVRESLLLQPLARQVLFQRFNYSLPEYGQIHPASLFQTSQITHVGMVIQADSGDVLDFYEQVLGLLRARDGIRDSYESNPAARPIFDLQLGDTYITTDFDDPRSSATDIQVMRSGRLKIICFPRTVPLANVSSVPGHLGMSLYTYRVSHISEYWQRVNHSNAQSVTEIWLNEFGEPSFSFIAPDGYFWTLVGTSTPG
jgi:hypothetical protein